MPHFFTDRRGGHSLGVYNSLNLALHVGDDQATVMANRALIGEAQFMNQLHGDLIVEVDHLLDEAPNCDALITTKPGLALAVMVADCIPLLLISKEVVAAVHVGRAGLLNQIALKTLQRMRSLGAIDIHAILGASICGHCYEVPFELQQQVIEQHPRSFSTTRKGTPGLDLEKGLVASLLLSGVSCQTTKICTFESDDHFSYRRSNQTGRFVGVVSL